jgi:Domain of unknown function (DUF4166)
MNVPPALQTTLGADWWQLAPVVRRHHHLRTHSADQLNLDGTMREIWHSRWLDPFLPIVRLLDAIVPYIGADVPAQVRCQADPTQPRVHWQREFRFADGKIGTFKSFKEFSGDHEVCEVIRGGIAAKLSVSAHNGGLVFAAKSYEWRIGKLKIPLPLTALIGVIRCEEIPLNADQIRIVITFDHPWLGCLVRYDGVFDIPVWSHSSG